MTGPRGDFDEEALSLGGPPLIDRAAAFQKSAIAVGAGTAREQNGVKMQYARFFAAFLVYAIIDIIWNILPPVLAMYENFYESTGHDVLRDQFGRPVDEWSGLVLLAALVFFLLIGLANSVLAIEPALREQSLLKAARNSFVFGCAAYATYVVPQYMATATWPGVLVPIDILIGGMLSLITSSAITYGTLRLRRRAV